MQQFRAFVEQAEARQREERDKVFTLGGIAGVVGGAAMHTPSMVMAQADTMVKAGIPQAQTRAALAQADVLVASGVPQAHSTAALSQVDAAMKSGNVLAQNPSISASINALGKADATPALPVLPSPPAAPGATESSIPSPALPSPPAPPIQDAFSADLGRKLFVEFIGSPSLTAALRNRLVEQGHTLVANADGADVRYRFEGEYFVPETKQYSGISSDVGAILEAPDKPLPAPEKKLMGSISLGIGQALFGLAALQGAAQGKSLPAEVAPQAQSGFQQTLLLVAARQPREGKETRVSVSKTRGGEINATALALEARDDLFNRLALPSLDNRR